MRHLPFSSSHTIAPSQPLLIWLLLFFSACRSLLCRLQPPLSSATLSQHSLHCICSGLVPNICFSFFSFLVLVLFLHFFYFPPSVSFLVLVLFALFLRILFSVSVLKPLPPSVSFSLLVFTTFCFSYGFGSVCVSNIRENS